MITRERLFGKNGYDIPGLRNFNGEKKIVLICHGFGSSKESPMTMQLAVDLPPAGFGTYSFDFPAHGESPVEGEQLRIENCLNDLASAEAWIKRLNPDAEICYFGSSFGAYILLLYLAKRPHAGRRAFFRSAAVDMPGLFFQHMAGQKEEALLKSQGYFFVEDYDYARPMKIVQGFVDDLAANNVFEQYRPGAAELFFLHGEADETADPDQVRRFAAYAGAELLMVPGGEHRLMEEGEPELVVEKAVAFFSR